MRSPADSARAASRRPSSSPTSGSPRIVSIREPPSDVGTPPADDRAGRCLDHVSGRDHPVQAGPDRGQDGGPSLVVQEVDLVDDDHDRLAGLAEGDEGPTGGRRQVLGHHEQDEVGPAGGVGRQVAPGLSLDLFEPGGVDQADGMGLVSGPPDPPCSTTVQSTPATSAVVPPIGPASRSGLRTRALMRLDLPALTIP